MSPKLKPNQCDVFQRGLLLAALLVLATSARAEIPIVIAPESPKVVALAAEDLRRDLGQIFPQEKFVLTNLLLKTGNAILVGTVADAALRTRTGDTPPMTPESYVVHTVGEDGRQLGIIAGADGRGTAYAVYAVLEKLGCGFHLSGDVLPPARTNAFDFAGWNLANQPLFGQRMAFEWHNFLSGCSTWNLADWQSWIAQSEKMGFNAIMLHAYGNNPMVGYAFDGVAKPVGYLSTTIKGRDWSTEHVADVRRMFGGEVFDQFAFGAEAGLVPDDQRVSAAQSLMQQVFAAAAQRDMNIYLAVDVDTPSANPQELVTLLPESARFQASGLTHTVTGSSTNLIWLANPDTPAGYAFYRAQVAALLKIYPQVTTLVAWFRRDGTPWMNLKASDLPTAWQTEYAAEIKRTPTARNFWNAPGLFALGKVFRTFDRALKECGAEQVSVAGGTWGFEFLPAADRFFPAGVPLIGLDYDVIMEKPSLGTTDSRAPLREVGGHRPVIPVVWAQHDDGHYLGRPYTPLPDFASKLGDAKAAGFGVIHWTTRPLDLYFASLAKQVWQDTKNQPLRETCRDFAASSFGAANREIMGNYLDAWITGAPQFARETSDWFIDRPLTNIAHVVAGCRTRLAMINEANTSGVTTEQRQNLEYQRGLEEWIAVFHQAQGYFQGAQVLFTNGDIAGARKLMAQCHPGPVIEQFAKFSSIGGITRGEQGLIVSMNTRWLSHIISLRQALGQEPVRIDFAPTSHDLLAQQRGTYTFFFGPDHDVWETWGTEETGASVFTFPLETRIDLPDSAPAVWREVCRHGIEIEKPLTLAFRPILANDSHGQKESTPLLPGKYHLRLLMLDPDSTGPGQRDFDLKVADLPVDRVDMFQRTGAANRVLALDYSVTLKSAGDVEVTLTPVKGRVILCGAVLEPED